MRVNISHIHITRTGAVGSYPVQLQGQSSPRPYWFFFSSSRCKTSHIFVELHEVSAISVLRCTTDWSCTISCVSNSTNLVSSVSLLVVHSTLSSKLLVRVLKNKYPGIDPGYPPFIIGHPPDIKALTNTFWDQSSQLWTHVAVNSSYPYFLIFHIGIFRDTVRKGLKISKYRTSSPLLYSYNQSLFSFVKDNQLSWWNTDSF